MEKIKEEIRQEFLGKIKQIVVSVSSSDHASQLRDEQSAFIDYICVQLGIKKVFNNGTFERIYMNHPEDIKYFRINDPHMIGR